MYNPSTYGCDSFCTGTPQLVQVAQDPKSPYTDKEWEAMLGYKYDDNWDPTPVRQDYARAMGELGNQDVQFAPYHAPQTMQHVQAQPVPQPQKKVVMAGASWCGFSKKAVLAHKAKGVQDQIDEKWCDKQDKNHPLCKQTKGYPTYYSADGTVLKRGYTPNPETLVQK